MNIMKNILTSLLLFTFLMNTGLQAQLPNNGFPTPLDLGNQITPRELAESRKPSILEIKGNPFLFADKDKKGIVYSIGNSFEGDSLNYNIYQNEVVTFYEKDSVFVYDSQLIDSVRIDDKRLHRLNGKFYEPLQTGSKASLYKKYETRIQPGMRNPMDGSVAKSRLVIMDNYYVMTKANLEKLKPSKGSLDDIFGKQSPEMKKRMKFEQLEFKKEKDLIRIFAIYNSL